MSRPTLPVSAPAGRIYGLLERHRTLIVIAVILGVLAGGLGAAGIRMDMSFRPVFTDNQAQLRQTAAFQGVFGEQGLNTLIVMADIGDDSDPQALLKVHALAGRLHALPRVVTVLDPLSFPFVDSAGHIHPAGVAAEVASAGSSAKQRQVIESVEAVPSAQRIVFSDDRHQVAVTVSLAIATSDFPAWRAAVTQFRQIVAAWSQQTGIPVQITGYPQVEQVYAHEILVSVLRSIAVLLTVMIVILLIYFRRWQDVVICLAGVTLAVPAVLGLMRFLGQPFSIVNSQVLTLVLIVGIAEALHHQQEYRRRREAGRTHREANREAFTILAGPAFMTGLATAAGFAALLTANMNAISSFGLCTTLGVVLVYCINWTTVPALVQVFYRNAPVRAFRQVEKSWTVSVLRRADGLLQRRPGAVVLCFVLVTAAMAAIGLSQLSIDQKVNQELPSNHPAVVAESTYEKQFAGFLGPELWVTRNSHAVVDGGQLAAFVDQLCALPKVRYVGSPLDLVPQPDVTSGDGCPRRPGDLRLAVAARNGRAGSAVRQLADGLISPDGSEAAIIVRVPDIGTAKSLPLVNRIQALARTTMPGYTVEPVGEWWLAQQGMYSLSSEMMTSAVTALALILPIMWVAIRDRKLFLAAILPTVLPVLASLGFMGILHITVRIGTAMILAISLGLAADDTIHLSVRIRDRIRAGSDPASALAATMLRTGRPASFSSYVLIAGFASMMASSLIALKEMGLIAAFTMLFALATDLLLGPALYLLLVRRAASRHARLALPPTAGLGRLQGEPSR
jgi:uncharacterized protein